MKKLIQTRLSTGAEPHLRGNCFPTVLACIMEISVEEVIQIQEYYDDENWPCILDDWLLSKGWQLMTELDHLMDGSYYLVSGISPRNSNVYHVCIYQNGKLIHDPHPSEDGIIGELYFYSFNKIQNENRN